MKWGNLIPALILLVGCAGSNSSDVTRCEADFEALQATLNCFRIRFGRSLTPEEGFQAFAEKPESWSETSPWRRYLKPWNLIDPWGGEYIYLGESTSGQYLFYSKGPDGFTSSGGNDPDDLNSWSPEHNGIFYDEEGRVNVLTLTLLTIWVVLGGCLLFPRDTHLRIL